MESKGVRDEGTHKQSLKERALAILVVVIALSLPAAVILGGISYELTGFGINVWSSEDFTTTAADGRSSCTLWSTARSTAIIVIVCTTVT